MIKLGFLKRLSWPLRVRIRKSFLIRPIQNSWYRVASCETITVKATTDWTPAVLSKSFQSIYSQGFFWFVHQAIEIMSIKWIEIKLILYFWMKVWNWILQATERAKDFAKREIRLFRLAFRLKIAPDIIQMNLQKFNCVFFEQSLELNFIADYSAEFRTDRISIIAIAYWKPLVNLFT